MTLKVGKVAGAPHFPKVEVSVAIKMFPHLNVDLPCISLSATNEI